MQSYVQFSNILDTPQHEARNQVIETSQKQHRSQLKLVWQDMLRELPIKYSFTFHSNVI